MQSMGRAQAADNGPPVGRSIVGWWQIGLGAALAAVATVALISGGPTMPALWWWAGVIAFGASLTLAVAGISAVAPPSGLLDVPDAHRTTRSAAQRRAPLLGELALQCGLITAWQLDAILAERGRTAKPTGQTLRDLGLVTEEELQRLLRLQCELRDPWRSLPGRSQ